MKCDKFVKYKKKFDNMKNIFKQWKKCDGLEMFKISWNFRKHKFWWSIKCVWIFWKSW